MKKVKRRVSKKKITRLILILLIPLAIIGIVCYTTNSDKQSLTTKINKKKELTLESYVDKEISLLEEFATKNDLKLEKTYEYSDEIKENNIISQNIEKGTVLKKGDTIKVVISKGEIPTSVYEENNVNELGHVPIMMYHGIHNMNNTDTKYTGGNVDKDGYNRTTEAFRNDLEYYYQNNYRMIRLDDYINGEINVELGKSPIVITFDDGKENNFKVLGEKDGELEIDPNCAVGILEEFKKKYPDYNVTATFFVNSTIFEQEEYNEKILKWLVSHGYDVGNHTMTHPDFTKINEDRTLQEVGGLYKILEQIIPGKYVNIIAMPFGSPYKKDHPNFNIMLKGTYEGLNYETKSMLRVGWEAELSPFDKEFDQTFLKRIRAYDHNGTECDIEMNFQILKNNRYISDGDKNTIVVKESDKDKVNTTKKIKTY